MHIFVISLSEPPQRRQSAIGKLRPTGLRFEIVDGVEARKWRTEELPIAPDVWPRYTAGQVDTAGQVGCHLAHLRALRRLVDYELKWACILEDDFCFESDPDLELSELETTFPEDFHYIHLQRDVGINPNYTIVERCGPYHRILGTPLCSLGYIVTRPLAEYVLQHHAEFSMPIDHLYSTLSHRGRFYAVAKPLVGIQSGLESTIHADSIPKPPDTD